MRSAAPLAVPAGRDSLRRYLVFQDRDGTPSFSARYTNAMGECGGLCPTEAVQVGRLTGDGRRRRRLPFDRTLAGGYWAVKAAVVLALPRSPQPGE